MFVSLAPSASPSDVRSTSVTTSTASFAWGEVPCGGRNGVIQRYNSSLVNSGYTQDAFSKITSSMNVTFEGLQPCTEYIFSVSALDGPMSDGIGIQTSDVGKFEFYTMCSKRDQVYSGPTRSSTTRWIRLTIWTLTPSRRILLGIRCILFPSNKTPE